MLHYHSYDVFPLRKLLLLCLMLSSLASSAFTVDGIEYRDCTEPNTGTGMTVEVVGGEAPDSVLTIPGTVLSPDGVRYTVRRIGLQAFKMRKDIKKVNLPKDRYIDLWQGAFQNCENLEEIDLSYVYLLSPEAFRGCPSLKKVILSKTLKYLDQYVFAGCNRLSYIDLSEITSLYNGALQGCPLTDCIPPRELERVESYALSKTSDIKSVVYTGDVSGIGDYAFYGSRIESVTLRSKRPVEIPSFAFRSCKQLQAVNIESSGIKSIGKGAFMDCELLKPFTLDGVITIGDFAFSGCRVWDTLELSKSLTSIGEQAFYNAAFTHVEFPEWVKESNIGAGAFQSAKLVSVKWPATWSDLTRHRNMFANSTATLEEVVLPGKCTTIPDYTFEGCSKLRTVTGGKNITSIGKYAFSDCTSLESFTQESPITEIGIRAFSNCTSLKDVEFLYPYLKTIRNNAFTNCKSLEWIGYSEISEIGSQAFMGSGISDINLGDDAVIGSEAFMDCKQLTGLLYDYDMVTRKQYDEPCLYIPASAKSIGIDAFRNCTSLKGIIFAGDADAEPLVLMQNPKTNYRSPFVGCPVERVVIERDIVSNISDSPVSPLNFICLETKLLRLGHYDFFNGYMLTLTSLPIYKNVMSLPKLEKLHIAGQINQLPSLEESPLLREVALRGDIPTPPKALGFHPDTYCFGTLDVEGLGDSDYRTTEPWSNFYKASALENVQDDSTDSEMSSNGNTHIQYYDIYGNRLGRPRHGIMIVRNNGKSSKVFVK